MKNLFILLFIFSFSVAKAQYPKLIVQLTDKNNSTFSLGNPAGYLSTRAILRRTRYGIAIDSSDLPVNKNYLDSLRLAGNVTILSTSKWLNQVLIQSTDQHALNIISHFPFVRSTRAIGYRNPGKRRPDQVEKNVYPVAKTGRRPVGTLDDVYDYGSNYNQVHIHEGEFLHNKGYRGGQMQITMLDAGFYHYKTITAFDSLRPHGQVLGERDFVDYDNSVNEDDAHGMECLSIMTANWPGRMVGTCPQAKYWLVRTENAATEYPIEEHNWVVGAEFADSTGSDLISSSLGYYYFDDPSFNYSYADFYKNSTMVSKGAAMAVNKGMIVMNSAGNEGNNDWKYLIFPADADSVCSVGAVNNAGNIAGFSSYGYPGKIKPNIVSVGAGTVIAGFNDEPVTGNGTSFSNPNIAGLIACLWQAFPQFSNMKILEAVYKSADRYNNPDNRFGYGIPNFRIAWQLLKHQQNVAVFGSDWLFAMPNPFSTRLTATFIGRGDGNSTLQLINNSAQIVASKSFATEKEEVYNWTFDNLGGLPEGFYTLRYSDADTIRNIPLQKGNLLANDWLVTIPSPFSNQLTVYIKAPETGSIALQMFDAKGALVEEVSANTVTNEISSLPFKNAAKLAGGVYYIRYIGPTRKRTVAVLKQ